MNTLPPNRVPSFARRPEVPAPKKSQFSKIVVLGLLVVTVFSLGAAYFSYTKLREFRNDPQKLAQDEVDEVVERVKQIMVLPEGEQPTLATVADPTRLQDQPFFANAKVGDQVLLYANARKAILYDPAANKIVEVAPINIGNPSPLSDSEGS